MDLQQYILVFAKLLIIALILVVPVSGASHIVDIDNVLVDLAGSPDTENATLIRQALAGHTTGSAHAPAPADSAALPMATVPDMPVFDTISPGDSIQDAVDAAADGQTLYLDPGTYFEHDITIAKNITIRSNISAGGNRYNTIVDAGGAGRIFNVAGAYTLAIDSLTLQNGAVVTGGDTVEGGAIFAEDENSTLIITSTSFSDFSVTGSQDAGGGAISSYGAMAVTSSSFENCTVSGLYGYGGAIWSGTVTTITSSSFEQCSVDGMVGSGGAVAGANAIISSSFTGCTARGGLGAFGGAVDGADVITSSTFTDCSASDALYSFGGAIYDAITITGCTFTNCSSDDAGGAISFANTIASSSFTGCSATYRGGAIYIGGGSVSITGSTISGCSAADGGAVNVWDGSVTITGSTITGCSATSGNGGAIYVNDISTTSISDSAISGCSASGNGGAIYVDSGSTLTITGSTFTSCSAPSGAGGAVYVWNGTVTITGTTFSGCSALYGGAINSYSSPVTIASSTFTGCSATGGNGGAIDLFYYNTVTITGTTFSGCSATGGNGGAIFSDMSTALSVTSSSFTGCSATEGSVLSNVRDSTATLHFCRIYQNTVPAVYNSGGPVDAENTWWGSNADPSGFVSGTVDYTPWLVLGITADPYCLTVPQTSAIRLNLTYDSDGTDTAGGGIFVPDGTPGTFAVTSGPGIVAPTNPGTGNGIAQTIYVTLSGGTATIAGTIDGETLYVTLNVAQGTWTPAPTEVPNDDDWPQVSSGASGGSGGVSAATTGSTGFPLMTVIVNIGGDSKAWQAIVTGTKLSDLIVTGTVQHGAGDNMTAPPGVIFQYISLVPARYDTITNAVINFTVPQAWLDENDIAPENIVLYRQTANGWEALPTTVLYAKDGTAYFSAQSGGFSLFAIAGSPAVATPAITTVATSGSTMPVQATTRVVATTAPVTTETPAPPAPAEAPAGPSPFPVVPALVGLCCVGLIGGGVAARRWWIRRQNPALYADYE